MASVKELIPAFEITIPPLTILFMQLSELRFNPKEVVPAHKHQIFEIRFMKSGKIISRLNRDTYRASENILFFIRPGDTHYQYTSAPTVMYHLGFVVTGFRGRGGCGNSRLSKLSKGQTAKMRDIWSYPSAVFRANERIAGCLKDIYSDALNDGRVDYGRMQEYITRFMSELCNELFELNSKKGLLEINTGGLDGKTKRAVKISISDIKENYAKRVDLGYLSRKVNFCKRHLERVFRKASGCSLNEYLMKVRTLKSYNLLKQPGFKIEAAIKDSGFNNSGRFYKYFKKYIGISPGRLKKYQADIKSGTVHETSHS